MSEAGGAVFNIPAISRCWFTSIHRTSQAGLKPSLLQNPITLQANKKVRKLLRLLELERVVGVRNLHPAYCSLLVKFDALKFSHEEVEGILRRFLARLDEVKLSEPGSWKYRFAMAENLGRIWRRWLRCAK